VNKTVMTNTPGTNEEPEAKPDVMKALLAVLEDRKQASSKVTELVKLQQQKEAELEQHIVKALFRLVDGLDAKLISLSTQIRAAEENIGNRVGALALEISRARSQMDVLEQNLLSVRTLGEATVRRMEQLSTEFIEREVTDELFIGYLKLYESLLPLDGAATKSKEWLTAFLENRGLRIITPLEKEKFNPAEHRVMKAYETNDAKQHGRVVKVLKLGLAREGRIIEFAWVEVYKYNK